MRINQLNDNVASPDHQLVVKEVKAEPAAADVSLLTALNQDTLVEVLTHLDFASQNVVREHIRNKAVQQAWFSPIGCLRQHRLRQQILAEPAQIPTLLDDPENSRLLNNWESFDFARYMPNFVVELYKRNESANGNVPLAEIQVQLKNQQHGVQIFLEQYKGKTLGAFEYLWQAHVFLLGARPYSTESHVMPLLCDASAFHRAIKAAKSIDFSLVLDATQAPRLDADFLPNKSCRTALSDLDEHAFKNLAKTLSTHGSHLSALDLGQLKGKHAAALLTMRQKMPQLTHLGIAPPKIILRQPELLFGLRSLETHIDGLKMSDTTGYMMNDPLPLFKLLAVQAPQLQRLKLGVWFSSTMGDKVTLLRAIAGVQDFTLASQFDEHELQAWHEAIALARAGAHYRTKLVRVD